MNKREKQNSLAAVIHQIDELLSQKKRVVVALDGRSGAGKSTIAQKLAKKTKAVIINCDDFYSGPPKGDEQNWHNKTAEEKINQVFEWQRMKQEVVEPLAAGSSTEYHPFNFQTGLGLSAKTIRFEPAPVIILDGVYTAEKLKDIVDISVLVDFPDEARRSRLIQREGEEFMSSWHEKWDEAEDYYFNQVRPPGSFDFRILGKVDQSKN